MNKQKLIIKIAEAILLCFLVGVLCSCSMAKSDATTSTNGGRVSNSSAQSDSSTKSTTTRTTAKTKPALNQTSFTLSLEKPQTYTEYTLPIYLTAQNTLHLAWSITGEGEYFRLAFTTPDGKIIAAKADGSIADLPPNGTCEKLPRDGSLILTMSKNNWDDGYYIFRPNIVATDKSISVKVFYWID
jgi:hypothetical protein